MLRRTARISSVSLSTCMSSVTGVAQAGTMRPPGRSFTRQTRQEVDGSHCREKQSVGISMPNRSAASRIVDPAGMSISRWSMVTWGILYSAHAVCS